MLEDFCWNTVFTGSFSVCHLTDSGTDFLDGNVTVCVLLDLVLFDRKQRVLTIVRSLIKQLGKMLLPSF